MSAPKRLTEMNYHSPEMKVLARLAFVAGAIVDAKYELREIEAENPSLFGHPRDVSISDRLGAILDSLQPCIRAADVRANPPHTEKLGASS